LKRPECKTATNLYYFTLYSSGVFRMGQNLMAGMLFIGMAIGTYIPVLPAPLDIINPFLGLIFLIVGVIFFIKG